MKCKVELSEGNSLFTLDIIKQYLHINYDYDDELLKFISMAAVNYAELFTGLSILQRKVSGRFKIQDSKITLPYMPVISIDIIKLGGIPTQRYTLQDIFIILGDNNLPDNADLEYHSGVLESDYALKQSILSHIYILYEKEDLECSGREKIKNLYAPYKKTKI